MKEQTRTEKLEKRLGNTPIETTAYEGKCCYMYLNDNDLFRILLACKEAGLVFRSRNLGGGNAPYVEEIEI
ncbi:hypothetical protein ES703_60426 [subsurface metagenome]